MCIVYTLAHTHTTHTHTQTHAHTFIISFDHEISRQKRRDTYSKLKHVNELKHFYFVFLFHVYILVEVFEREQTSFLVMHLLTDFMSFKFISANT